MTGAGAVTAILASAVIVLGGLVALVRSIWKIAQYLKDNTSATTELTANLKDLRTSIDGQLDALAGRVALLEGRRWRR